MPITWRNVEGGTGYRDAMTGTALAQKSLDSGISSLKDILVQSQNVDAANFDNARKNNTSTYLDRLAQARTPEELAALQASGELEQLKVQNIDRDRIRGAETSQMTAVREGANAARQYEQGVRAAEVAPSVEEYMMRKLANDDEGAAAIADQNRDAWAAAGVGAETAQFGLNTDQNELAQTRATTTYDQGQEAIARDEASRERTTVFEDLLAQHARMAATGDNTVTEYRESLGAAIRNTPGATNADVSNYMTQFDDTLFRSSQLSQVDATELARTVSGLERKMEGNVFAADQGKDPLVLANEALTTALSNNPDLQGEFDKMWGGSDKSEIIDTVSNTMMAGVEIKGADGKSVRVPVPASVMALALQKFSPSFLTSNDNQYVQKALAELMEQEGIVSQFEEHAQYREVMSTIQQDAQKRYGAGPREQSLIDTFNSGR